MADIIDKHLSTKRRVRKLELEVTVREGTDNFADLAKHTHAIAEHLCRPTEVPNPPYGRLAAHLFDAEQNESNMEILRLLRNLREKVGALQWIGNYGSFRGPQLAIHTNFQQFDGFEGIRRVPSPLNFIRVGRWAYPVIMPIGAALSSSWMGAPSNEKWSAAQIHLGEHTFALGSIGGTPPWTTGLKWLPVPAGQTFDGVTIAGEGRSIRWTKGPFKEPPEYDGNGDRISEKVPIGVDSPNDLFVLGAQLGGAPRVCYMTGVWGASIKRSVDFESCSIGASDIGPVRGRALPFYVDAGPPPDQTGYVRGGPDKPLPYQSRTARLTREVMASLADRFTDPTEGLNPVALREGAGGFGGRGGVSRMATAACDDGNGGIYYIQFEEYTDGGVSSGDKYYCFPTDWVRAAGPPVELTAGIVEQSVWRFNPEPGLATKPWSVPSYDQVLANVEAFLGTPGAPNITNEELEALGYYVPYPGSIIPGTQEIGFPQALIEWYSRLLGNDIYESGPVATYPGTDFAFDEETYQHNWTLFVNDARGTIWYIIRHGVVHLKGFIRPDAGLILLPPHLRPPIAAGAGYSANYLQFPLVAADGTRNFAYISENAQGVPQGGAGLVISSGGPQVHPYYLDGIRWPIA